MEWPVAALEPDAEGQEGVYRALGLSAEQCIPELCRPLSLTAEQAVHDLFNDRIRAASEFLLRDSADGVIDGNDPCALETGLLARLLCQGGKLIGRDDHRRCSVCFEPCRVVETPRRARASIRGAGQDQIGSAGDLVDQLVIARRRCRSLAADSDKLDAGPLSETLRDTRHHECRARLSVVEYRETSAPEPIRRVGERDAAHPDISFR